MARIDQKVRNLALEEILSNDKAMVLEPNSNHTGMVGSLPDFDEEPINIAIKYKTQLDQLDSRIFLLRTERETVEKVF